MNKCFFPCDVYARRRFLPALFVGICLMLSCAVCAQSPDSILGRVMQSWEKYADHHRAPGIFLHLDKSIYEHTEHVQFTAWLLGGDRDTTQLHALYVLLVDPSTRKMVTFDRFALARYGATGALYLADTLHPGKYLVVAYTDDRLRGWEQQPFRGEITLLPDAPPPFGLTQKPDTTRLTFRVSTDYGGLAAGASFRYRLQAAGLTVDSGEKKIDAFGEVSLPVPAGPLLLTAMVKRQDQTAWFWQPVVTRPAEWRVHYYPEGGDLVAGHPSQIGVEIRDAAGVAVAAQGRLLEDGLPAGVFETNDNGWGLLSATCQQGHAYTVDFPDKPAGVIVSGNLPTILPEGYSLLVHNGIARDSVEVHLYFPAPDLRCRLLVYNDREIVYASSLLAHSMAARMSIPVKDWPSGLLTMTLFDPQGLPVAERRLYAPTPSLSVTILPDSTVYHPRSRIRVLIHTADAKGQGVPALFSLATVLSTRLRTDQEADIRRYAAIDRYLPGPFPGSEPGYGMPALHWEDDATINLLLLTRGWTRYHWQELAADSLPLSSGPPVADYGYVLYRDRKPPAPLTMLVMGGSLLTFQTDSSGRFNIPPTTEVSNQNGDLALSLAGGDRQDEYQIILLNRYDSVNRRLAGAWYVPLPSAPEARATHDSNIPAFAHAKTLQKVVVTPGGGKGNDGCRDYICVMGILNCRNHPYGRKPIIGEVVLEADGFNQFRRVVYRGCEITEQVYPPFLRRVKPICLLKQAYVNDTTPIPPSATALYTTLHWAPLVETDGEGNAEVSFYANDLPGLYYNVLQGFSLKGVISGRQSFSIVSE